MGHLGRGPRAWRFLCMVIPVIALVPGAQSGLATPLQNQYTSPRVLTNKLFSQWTQKTPGASVAIMQDGRVTLATAYGSADLRFGLSITPHTRFAVGSITKQFTAFTIYTLSLNGKIGLHNSIRDYLPELPVLMGSVTVQELLWQTSGIRDYIELAAMSGHQLGDSLTMRDALALLQNQRQLNFNPGTQYNYSNSNYALLAEIVHRVTGKPFAQYVSESIFQPLGMHDSIIQDSHSSIIPAMARSYWPTDTANQYAEAEVGSDVVGDSGLVTTPSDLLIWEANLMSLAYGKAEILMMLRPALLSDGHLAHDDDGSGIFVEDERGIRVLTFNGGIAGFRADVVAYPERKVSVAIFTNLVTFFPDAELSAISDMILGRKSSPEPSSASPEEQSQPFIVDSVTLGGYDGGYRSDELDTTYWICQDAKGLVARHLVGPSVTLIASAKDTFFGSFWWFNKVWFSRDKSGQVDAMSVSGFRAAKDVSFKKISNTCDLAQ